VLADENDVVVVGINYRLGAFGFAMGPGIDTNVGLRDQRMAIEVRVMELDIHKTN
jgi:carboxylesterase type B